MLEIDSLSAGYGLLPVLNSVTLRVKPGEFAAIVGPNGAGKTTLFKTVSGIVRPTSGNIRFEGRDLLAVAPAARAHLGGGDAGEIELHGERFREQARIALGDARAAALAHADLDDAERFEGAQGVTRHDAACVEAGGEVFFDTEEVAGLELLGEKGIADPGNDLRRQR